MLNAMSRQAAHAKEVFQVDITSSQCGDHAAEILSTLQQIQANPELLAEAKSDPERVLSRFNLSVIARHAVAFGLMGAIVGPAVVAPVVSPNGFW